ncbi:MAG: hypothetical protein LBE34_03970 [Flavobacteriaceae bacterium]|nr:hypothetical protein [Flavobacteriaceae bacterium]
MIQVSFIEFQENLKKYIELASTQRVVVTQGDDVSFKIEPVENSEEKYNSDFVQEILQVNEEAQKGYVVKINNVNDIWKDIHLNK